MSDTVQQVKDKLSIMDVISPYVKLTRAGKYWKGLSPFNKEKTPSFYVSPDRGLYHCFSSGKGGDMFTFIEEMEGVDFKGALKILAEKAGVPLVYEKSSSDEREKIFDALSAAQDFFVQNRKNSPEIDAYLLSRGLSAESVETWGIGYALPQWRTLQDELVANGTPEEVLLKAGLVKRPDSEDGKVEEKKTYDRFRGRIMFPIRDSSGRVVGFSGRIYKDDPAHPQAKYLNSPETAVFDKSKILYGLYESREGIRSLNSVILVEGQMDLVMSHQAGFKNTVATSGTSFTKSHAELIRRYTPNLLIAYDGDRAGVAAAGRASMIALPLGLNVKIARFAPGEDPADTVQRDIGAYKNAIRGAVHVVDFYLEHAKNANYDPRTFRLEVSRTVLPYIAMIENRIDQAHFIKKVAEALSVPEEAVAAELQKLKKPEPREEPSALQTPVEPFLSRADSIERLVYGLMLTFRESGKTAEADEAEAVLKETVGETRLEILARENGTDRAAIFGADMFLELHAGNVAEALKDVYADFYRESIHEKYREALSALRIAEQEGNRSRAESLMGELASLAKSLA